MSTSPNNLTIVFNSDILESDAQVIAHQCNCKSKKAKGLSKSIADRFPYADIYSIRDTDSTPGTIKIMGNRKRCERFICAMFAQLNPGKPRDKDTSSQRQEWFRMCLDRLGRTKSLKSVAFPYKIGCGMAGGDWNIYHNLISKWAENNPSVKIFIISNDEPKPSKPISHVDFNEFCIEHTKRTVSRIEMLTIPQKIYLLNHLLKDIKADVVLSSSKVLDTIETTNICLDGIHTSDTSRDEKNSITSTSCNEEIEVKDSDGEIEIKDSDEEEVYSDEEIEVKDSDEEEVYSDEEIEVKDSDEEEVYSDEEIEVKDSDEEEVYSDEEIEVEDSNEEGEDGVADWGDITLKEYIENFQPEGYEEFFNNLLENDGLDDISEFIETELKNGHTIYPSLSEIFTAFELCPLENMKVVIIGQDPYHTAGAAMGVAFGHHSDRGKIQPSIRNIYKALENDGFSADFSSGDLTKWCRQGVFLINTALTVREGGPASHAVKLGKSGPWEYFIGQIFHYLNENCEHLVIMAWGTKAQDYTKYFTESGKHFIITAPHPAYSVYNHSNTDFFDHKPFSKANKYLKKWKMEPIDWNL
jgi:uracil-DNA glycosylase